ncbi:hypothetical protein N7G274_002859 [Stereocaulon virgatum]|uniref:C2H2-type domain-containing protein n=1 Tax=Stereocaulon virgatum TaxID=373712 RepID=A0ABR4AFA9_9LECA
MSATSVPPVFSEIFEYLEAYNVLVCKVHGYGIRSPAIQSHLNSFHKDLDPKTRGTVAKYARGLYTDSVQYPSNLIDPIPYMPLYRECFKCVYPLPPANNPCNAVYRKQVNVQDHLKAVHDWVNPRKRGGDFHVPAEGPWVSGVLIQKFFVSGSDQRFFEVNSVELQPDPADSSDDSVNVQTMLDQFQSSVQQVKEQIRSARVVVRDWAGTIP